jgi:hypothetical protein
MRRLSPLTRDGRRFFFNGGNVLRVEYTPIIMTKGGGFTFD